MNTLLFITFLAFGVFFIYLSCENILSEKFGEKFIPVTGVISKSKKYETDGTEFIYGDGAVGVMYGITIEYEYVFDGKSYQGNKISRNVDSGASSDGGNMYGLEKMYPVNKEVTVYVNPEDHSDAYLDNKPKVMFLLLVLGLMFCLSGVFLKLIF